MQAGYRLHQKFSFYIFSCEHSHNPKVKASGSSLFQMYNSNIHKDSAIEIEK